MILSIEVFAGIINEHKPLVNCGTLHLDSMDRHYRCSRVLGFFAIEMDFGREIC